jgi:hypothetical protein
MWEIRHLMGKEVEVLSHGIRYSGLLVEVSDTEVHLKSSMQWISLPVDQVSDIKLKGDERGGLDRPMDWGDVE